MELQEFTRKQLYDLVWKEPIQIIAPKFGLSDRGLAKLCERHAIPTPPRGYWAKKQAGHKVAKAPLIELEGSKVKDTHAIAKFASQADASSGDNAEIDPLLAFWRAQRDQLGEIKVAQTLANPHSVVAGWVKEDEQHRQTRSSWGASLPAAPRATSIERRRLRILSALYRALEQRGVTVHCARNSRDVEFRHERDATSFNLYEYTKQDAPPFNRGRTLGALE